MTRRYGAPLTLCCGVLAVVASYQTWWTLEDSGQVISLTGASATGNLANSLAINLLCLGVLAWWFKGRSRRLVALMIILFGVGAAVLTAFGPPVGEAVQGVDLGRAVVVAGAGRWLYLAATVLSVGAGISLIPAGADPPAPAAESVPDPAAPLDTRTAWAALDSGRDPTEDGEYPEGAR